MCIVITSDIEFPFRKILELAEARNPHGGGIAWLHEDKVRYMKGLTANEIAKARHYTTAPWIIHFRIATVGGIIPELTHPFPVDTHTDLELYGESDAVLAHNGHWWGWQREFYPSVEEKDYFPDGAWSDSRAMAWMAGKYGENYLRFINKNQRVAYLDKNGIRRYGEGWMRHGPLWLSNDPFGGRYAHSIDRRAYSEAGR